MRNTINAISGRSPIQRSLKLVLSLGAASILTAPGLALISTSPAAAQGGSATQITSHSLDPIAGNWNVTYGAPAVVTMTLSSGVYTETAETPVEVTGSSCDLPVGTIIATFSSTGGNTYSGSHGLWYSSDCVFANSTGLTLTLSSDGNELTGELGDGEQVTFTKAVTQISQSALTVTTVSGTLGTPFALETAGGSGTGAVTCVVTNGMASGCTVSGSSLSASTAGTCIVTATKAADATYLAVSSTATTITLFSNSALGSNSSLAVVQGVVDCSNLISAAGFAGSPSRLSLNSGSVHATMSYPRRLRTLGGASTFGFPELERYKLRVPVPSNENAIAVKWTLSCQDRDGNPAGTQSGQFSLAKRFTTSHPASRNICNHHGTTGIVLTLCNPALEARLGACAWEVFTDLAGSDVLSAASVALDPPKNAIELAETALAHVTGPLGGLILACVPAASSSPTATTTPAGTGSSAWPVHRDDGSPAFFAYLGASFIAPNWTSCDASFCLAGTNDTVYVFNGELDQMGTISISVSSPLAALTTLGIPLAVAQGLLAPTG